MKNLPIQTALISVTDKSELGHFAQGLKRIIPSLKIIASGGTSQTLSEAGIPCTSISEHTKFSECFGGRVKTLHPNVMGGILYRRDKDEEEANKLGIEGIDLVVCNLYDFKTACRDRDATPEQLIEQMDIGGSALIRSACKNFSGVAVVVDPRDYHPLLVELEENGGKVSLETRKRLAVKAINLSANYEALLAQELSSKLGSEHSCRLHLTNGRQLRYGENPDQAAWVYEFPDGDGIAQANVLSGKELSYNNYEDATLAFHAAQELISLNAAYGASVVKHGGLCGYATGLTQAEAFQRAWEGDAKSAFGSIIALTSPLTEELIPYLKNKFIEVIIAPKYSDEVVSWAKAAKPNLRLLEVTANPKRTLLYKGISGGMLVQTKKEKLFTPPFEKLFEPCDTSQQKRIGVVTARQPKDEQKDLFAFAVAAVAFAKSNTIAIVRQHSAGSLQLIGIGAGQPNRIDSLERLALPKAIENICSEGKDPSKELERCILASDGFFPFDDTIRLAVKSGIKSCIQPGGSTNDESVIAAANALDACMIFTGNRYFYH